MKSVLFPIFCTLLLVACGNKHKDLKFVVEDGFRITETSFQGSKDPGTRGQYIVSVNVPNPTKKEFKVSSVAVDVMNKQGDKVCSKKDSVGEFVAALGGAIDVRLEIPCMFQDVAPDSAVEARVNMTTYKGDVVQSIRQKDGIRMR